jgi:hypothetical protein
MATEMEQGHGRLWIYETDGQQTVAFPPMGWNTCGRCSQSTNVTDHSRGLERMVTRL